jgi:protein-tyrosine-phosphatase
LIPSALVALGPAGGLSPQPVLFVCSKNSARSQLAAALWTAMLGEPSKSAGTHPAEAIHPGAIAAARRAGLDLSSAHPSALDAVRARPALIITVCDRAHEELMPGETWLHWSIADPIIAGTRSAFDDTVKELRDRIRTVTAA